MEERTEGNLGVSAEPRHEALRERLGQRVKLLRMEHRWSLRDVAGRTGISISQLSAIERGSNLPSIESLLALGNAFGKPPSEILQSIGY